MQDWRKRKTRARAVIALALSFAVPLAAAADDDFEAACDALAGLASADYRIDAAEWQKADRQSADPAGVEQSLPAHCLFRAVLDPRPAEAENLSYGVGFELRLPAEWNGRFLFQGGGGFNGSLSPALGSLQGAPSALGRGFAVVTHDGGHRAPSAVDVRFGVDQQARLDFAYQSVEKTTEAAKAIIDQFYGRAPNYSYFMGCSTGGREAMLAAQRLPLEFDGVVSGNAARDFSRLVVNQVYSLQTVHRIAPRDANGQVRYSQVFSDAQLQGLRSAVLEQCDALDGLADGLINDFQACPFDPASQQCDTEATGVAGESQVCLSAEQVGALHDIFGGARNSSGEALYGSFAYDTGIAGSAWRGMHLGSGDGMPANAILGRDSLRGYVLTPPDFDFDPLSFDFDTDMARTRESAIITDASGILHSTFAGRGSKMIVYHGLSDQAMSTGSLIEWYEDLLPRDADGPQDWARLFLVPGMTHCGGGEATDNFDTLSAIQAWVEEGRAPESIIATGAALPDISRPLCPYPQVARYDGGDESDAASFSCR